MVDGVPPDSEAADSEDKATDPVAAPAAEPAGAAASRRNPILLGMVAGIVVVVALSGVAVFFGVQAWDGRKEAQQRAEFLAAGKQAALNLTTINHADADADIQRILESATGTFYDEFQSNAQEFVGVLSEAQAKTEGSVTAAGLESVDGDTARVLVTASVDTTTAAGPEQAPRSWRMRITVQDTEGGMKVANVGFVP